MERKIFFTDDPIGLHSPQGFHKPEQPVPSGPPGNTIRNNETVVELKSKVGCNRESIKTNTVDINRKETLDLNDLILSCDYRGGIITQTSCTCSQTWHCALGKGSDKSKPFEATKSICMKCVKGYDNLNASQPALKPPSLIQKGMNLTKSVVSHVSMGMPSASPELKERRLATCKACPDHDQGTCRRCGCILEIKTGWAGETCPAGLW